MNREGKKLINNSLAFPVQYLELIKFLFIYTYNTIEKYSSGQAWTLGLEYSTSP